MRILIACEFSGVVREAFRAKGHEAYSCDLLPTEIPSQYHIQEDVLLHLNDGWDMMIAHPPCQYISYAGNRWLNQPGRLDKIEDGIEFFMKLYNAPIEKIAVENPRGWIQKRVKETQIIQPYNFGECVSKATCLWLKNLPPLKSTSVCESYEHRWARNKKGSHSPKARSVTFKGIATALADQWG